MARAVWRIKFSNEENYKTMQNHSCCSDGGATVWHQLAGVESQSVAKSMASAACPWQNLPKCRVHVTTTVENVLVSVTGPTRYPNWHPMASVMSLRVCVATSVACQVFLEPHALTVEETLGRLGTEDALFGGVAYLASKVRGSPSLTLERIQELGLPTQPFAEFGLFGIQEY